MPLPALLQRFIRRLALARSASLRRRFRKLLLGQPLSSQEIGELGEQLAVKWLRKQGRKVLYRNFSAPEGGEVDIVCRHGSTLVFTEVKTRTSVGQYRPADAVNAAKQELIRRGAREWLRLLGRPALPFRFDIVEVILLEGQKPQLQVIEQAFEMPRGSLIGRV